MKDFMYDKDLKDMLSEAARAGATQALISVGQISPFLSKAEAYRLYGRKKVDKWLKMGILRMSGEPNEKQRIDRVEIQTIASCPSLANYINSQSFKDQGRNINIDEAYRKLNQTTK